MSIRNLWFTLCLIVLSFAASAQIEDFVWSDFTDAGNFDTEKLTGTKYIYSVFTARDHFYQPEWYEGTLTTIHGEVLTSYKLRYNGFTGELVAYNDRVKGLFVVDRKIVADFSVNHPDGTIQRFKKLTLRGPETPEFYFEILHEGEISVISHVRITEQNTSLFKNEFGLLDNRRFETLRTHYLVLADGSHMRIYSGRKWLLQLFPDRKKEVRRFLREQGFYDFRTPQLPRVLTRLDQANFF